VKHKVNFADIWANESYKATGLPKKVPVLAVVRPQNPDVVYFFLGKHLFGVNLRARKVVECEVYKLVGPGRKHVSSGCVRPCQLPAVLRAGTIIIHMHSLLCCCFDPCCWSYDSEHS
jgi:hypothetical protein